MGSTEFKLHSGAFLSVTQASFADAHMLVKALMKSAKGLPISENLLEMDMTVLKDMLLSAAISDEVETALFKCFQRASYDGHRVSRETMDTVQPGEQMRTDFYEICWRAIEVNCSPFFKRAFSLLRERLKTLAVLPKSESTATRP